MCHLNFARIALSSSSISSSSCSSNSSSDLNSNESRGYFSQIGAVGNHADKLHHARGNSAAAFSLSPWLPPSASSTISSPTSSTVPSSAASTTPFTASSRASSLASSLAPLPAHSPSPPSPSPTPSPSQPGHNINSTDLCSQMRAGLVAATARLAGNPKVKPTKQRTHLFIMIIRQGAEDRRRRRRSRSTRSHGSEVELALAKCSAQCVLWCWPQKP